MYRHCEDRISPKDQAYLIIPSKNIHEFLSNSEQKTVLFCFQTIHLVINLPILKTRSDFRTETFLSFKYGLYYTLVIH